MHIHFDKDEMARVTADYDRWWDGTLGRPLTNVNIYGAYPGAGTAAVPYPSQENCHDFSYSPRDIIRTIDAYKSDEKYTGDAYPHVSFSFFGPGIVAAMSGGALDNSSGAVWFGPGGKTELRDIHPRYDPENKWAKRIKDIYYAGLEYWDGAVIMGMPDLGGVLDIAASLRGTENLLTDLYDEPEEVLRLVGEIETAWYAAYNDFASVLAPQKGFSDWSGILSGTPSYICQCDFCYMISNGMFREFVLPTLKRDGERLSRVIYHLDGIGELRHLDDILALPSVRAVQWVPGSGKAPCREWMDVYKKIAAAGKHSWIVGSWQDYLEILGAIHGTPYFSCALPAEEEEAAKRVLSAR